MTKVRTNKNGNKYIKIPSKSTQGQLFERAFLIEKIKKTASILTYIGIGGCVLYYLVFAFGEYKKAFKLKADAKKRYMQRCLPHIHNLEACEYIYENHLSFRKSN